MKPAGNRYCQAEDGRRHREPFVRLLPSTLKELRPCLVNRRISTSLRVDSCCLRQHDKSWRDGGGMNGWPLNQVATVPGRAIFFEPPAASSCWLVMGLMGFGTCLVGPLVWRACDEVQPKLPFPLEFHHFLTHGFLRRWKARLQARNAVIWHTYGVLSSFVTVRHSSEPIVTCCIQGINAQAGQDHLVFNGKSSWNPFKCSRSTLPLQGSCPGSPSPERRRSQARRWTQSTLILLMSRWSHPASPLNALKI